MSDARFVRIENAAQTRRTLLEASKASLQILRGQQALAEVRVKKREQIAILRKDLRDLSVLLGKVEALLPQFSQAEINEMLPKESPVKKRASTPHREMLRRIEDQIAGVEFKLKML
jgi:hypothetical protein